jgi:hypothetical protein
LYLKVEFIRLTAVSVKAIKDLQLTSVNGKNWNIKINRAKLTRSQINRK